MASYIVALDQGTTSSRAILFDKKGKIVHITQQQISITYPKPGWVEQDPNEIWESIWEMLLKLINDTNIKSKQILGIGITNQRETTIVWDKESGAPIYPAISWQDKRGAALCEDLKKEGLGGYIKEETGLVIDAYFSATKLKWILDNVNKARHKAENGQLAFGTIDTWLLWKLTKQKAFSTDFTNASRTMLFNINTLAWDKELLKLFDIPISMLPEVKPSASKFGVATKNNLNIPIYALAGDQQAALHGQGCIKPGMAKNTYGTGCFMLMNTGKKKISSSFGLLTTLTCSTNKTPDYALEGSIFIAGAAIKWLRDGLEIIDEASETEQLAKSVASEHNIYIVPAFSGLGAPYWNMQAQGAIYGLTHDIKRAHLVKATLESLAYQTCDVLQTMQKESKIELKALFADGGASVNSFLMQFQSDILNIDVIKPKTTESTALGVAFLVGNLNKLWSTESFFINKEIEHTYHPNFSKENRKQRLKGWKKAIECTLIWANK